jgi:hypothetical protein
MYLVNDRFQFWTGEAWSSPYERKDFQEVPHGTLCLAGKDKVHMELVGEEGMSVCGRHLPRYNRLSLFDLLTINCASCIDRFLKVATAHACMTGSELVKLGEVVYFWTPPFWSRVLPDGKLKPIPNPFEEE